jgi:serine protease AprX
MKGASKKEAPNEGSLKLPQGEIHMSWMSLSQPLSLLFSPLLILSLSISSYAGQQVRFQRGSVKPSEFSTLSALPGNQEWILLYTRSPSLSEEASLRSDHLIILNYLPDDALVVRGSYESVVQAKANNPNITSTMAYPPSMKLAANLSAMSIFSRAEVELYLVKTFLDSDRSQVSRLIQKQNLGLVHEEAGNSLFVEIEQKDLLRVASLPGVEHIQEPAKMQTMDMKFEPKDEGSASEPLPPGGSASEPLPAGGDYTDITGMESGTKIMNLDVAWALGYEGQGQTAAMADTGLDSGNTATLHQDFTGAGVQGQIFGLYSKSWGDPMGHGTHVAGSIVGRGNASPVLSGGVWRALRGGAPSAGFVGQSMWSPMLSNLMVPSQLSALFAKAYEGGARVHSNSWGAPNNLGAYDNYANQVDDYMFQNQEMLVIFAAGNSGVDKDKDGRIDPGSASSPGTAKNALTVGASENLVFVGGLQKTVSEFRQAKDVWGAEPIWSSKVSDNPMGLAMFSSRGPTNDHRIKPEVVAPGTNILSVRSQDPKGEPLWGVYNKDYVWSGGTSMATPLVAGAATVARQILQQKYNIQNPSAALVKAALMNTAFDMYPGQYGEVGASRGQEILQRRPNSDEGYGRVDMKEMTGRELKVWDEKVGVLQGDTKSFGIEIFQTQKVVINMVYTDAPGSVNAAQALVNDLDLSLVQSDGKVLSEPKDRVNNHEVIEMTLNPGKYQIRVNGAKIPLGRQGSQSFAIVMSSY